MHVYLFLFLAESLSVPTSNHSGSQMALEQNPLCFTLRFIKRNNGEKNLKQSNEVTVMGGGLEVQYHAH